MWEMIKKILFWIWAAVLMLGLAILIILGQIEGNNGGIYLVCFLVIWVGIPAAIVALQIKRDEKRETKYREKFISKVVIENQKLGKMIFEKDQLARIFISEKIENSFGNHNPKILIRGCDENNQAFIFRNLEELYDNQEKILDDYYKEVKGYCDNWEETDSNGKEITEEFIKENITISSIDVQEYGNEFTITIWGALEERDSGQCLLGDHSITAQINCNTKEVRYDLEG